ncbi:MAG: hypothetical protein HYW24_00255 [Candidatus Aenigmarchaeota archaeon]|nr:hypothetical protein [Candidatus Aenigmarchaeota archaeon]
MKKILVFIFLFLSVIPTVLALSIIPPSSVTATHELVTITWTTDNSSTTEIEYGKDTTYGTNVTNESMTTSHTVTLTGLSSSTTYYYRAKSRDASGVQATASSSFATTASPSSDTTAPSISSISASSITNESAAISWTTDESATSELEYGKDTNYGSVGSNSTLKTSHKFTLTGLSSSTTYHYRVKSKDVSNNQGVSGDNTFTTLATQITQPSDTTSPAVGSASPTSVTPNKQSTFSATVSDNIGVKECKLVKNDANYTATVSSGAASYTFASGLPEGTHNIYFECKDDAGNVGKGTSVAVTSGKQSIQIKINLPKTTYYPNEFLDPKITVTDASGKLVTDAYIKGNLTGPKTYNLYFFYSSLCDCYKASYYLSESISTGDYTLSIEVSHSDFKTTSADASLKVIKPTIQTFTITADKKDYFSGDSVALTVTAKDALGNAIKDLYLTGELRDGDTGKLLQVIYPSILGDVYIYKYYLDYDSVGKKYQFTVSTTWKEQKANASTTITVGKRGLNADVVLEKNVLSPKDVLKGRIKVYDKDGETVKDASVGIQVKDPQGFATRYLSTTFKDGFYEIESWTVEDWFAVGNYTMEIKISKHPEEIVLTKAIEITKQKLNVEVSLDKTSYKPNDRMYMKILVTYPNGTVAKDAWVSGEVFPLFAEPATKEGFYKPSVCRIYLSPVKPVLYKGEFIQRYFLDSPYIPSECSTGEYALKLTVNAPGYADAEILKEFDLALAKLFIETGFRMDSQVDAANLVMYAEVKDENGKSVEFAAIDGTLSPTEELKGCVKQFTLYYDYRLKRYTGNQFISKYECTEGKYIIHLEASSTSYEKAEVVQGVVLQYKEGYEYQGYVPSTPFESACKEVSCGENCIQKVCTPVAATPVGECFNFVTDDDCINTCTSTLEKAEEAISKGTATEIDLKACVDKCATKVPCQGSGISPAALELMIQKLDELKKEVKETKEEVGGLKQMLLFIIDFINSILSKYLQQEQAITIPSEVVQNATNATNPITAGFVKVFKPLTG